MATDGDPTTVSASTPDEIDSGHCPALSRPRSLAELLEGYLAPDEGRMEPD